MIGVLIVTHGEIGEALLTQRVPDPRRACRRRSRPSASGAQDDPDDLVLRARELLEALDAGDGVLVLTDIFGATPGNVVSRLLAGRAHRGRVGRVAADAAARAHRAQRQRTAQPARRRRARALGRQPRAWCI